MRSMMVAVAIAPPAHIETSAVLAPRHSTAPQHPLGRRDRAVEVVVRLVADQALRHDLRPRPQAQLASAALIGEQHGRRAVGDL